MAAASATALTIATVIQPHGVESSLVSVTATTTGEGELVTATADGVIGTTATVVETTVGTTVTTTVAVFGVGVFLGFAAVGFGAGDGFDDFEGRGAVVAVGTFAVGRAGLRVGSANVGNATLSEARLEVGRAGAPDEPPHDAAIAASTASTTVHAHHRHLAADMHARCQRARLTLIVRTG